MIECVLPITSHWLTPQFVQPQQLESLCGILIRVKLPFLFSNVPLFTTTTLSSSVDLFSRFLPIDLALNAVKNITRIELADLSASISDLDSICHWTGQFYFISFATTSLHSRPLLQPSLPTFDASCSCILNVNRSLVNLLRGQQVLQEPLKQPEQYL